MVFRIAKLLVFFVHDSALSGTELSQRRLQYTIVNLHIFFVSI